jgi:hypothetical protein
VKNESRRPTAPAATKALLGAASVLLVLLAAACQGDPESEPVTRATDAGVTSGLAVTDGIEPADLLSCLEDADLPAVLNDSVPFGVEVPTEGIEVKPLGPTDPGSEQGADLWVFSDPATAEQNRGAITLSDADDDRNWVAGNVVVRLFYPAADGDPQLESIRGCLPA